MIDRARPPRTGSLLLCAASSTLTPVRADIAVGAAGRRPGGLPLSVEDCPSKRPSAGRRNPGSAHMRGTFVTTRTRVEQRAAGAYYERGWCGGAAREGERTGFFGSPCPVVLFVPAYPTNRHNRKNLPEKKKRNLTLAGSVRAAAQVSGNGSLGGPTQPLRTSLSSTKTRTDPKNGAQYYFCATKSTPAIRSVAVERSGRVCTGTLCVDLTLTTQSQERARAPPSLPPQWVCARGAAFQHNLHRRRILFGKPPSSLPCLFFIIRKRSTRRGPFNDEAPRKICYKEWLTD